MTESKRSKKKTAAAPVMDPPGENAAAHDEELDPAVIKLINYAKEKKEIFTAYQNLWKKLEMILFWLLIQNEYRLQK